MDEGSLYFAEEMSSHKRKQVFEVRRWEEIPSGKKSEASEEEPSDPEFWDTITPSDGDADLQSDSEEAFADLESGPEDVETVHGSSRNKSPTFPD